MRRLLLPLLLLLACAPRTPASRPPADAPPAPPPAAAPGAEAPAPARPFTLLVGGDVTLGHHYEEYFDDQVARGARREDMFAYGFRELRPLTEPADLFLVNLECPFTDRGEKVPKNFNFRARPEFISALLAGGVDAVSLANNHLMDFGVVGLMDTLATLDAAGVPHFGAGRNLAEARRPAIVTVHGTRVAFLGYFFLGTRNIEPVEVIATATTPGVAGHASDVEEMERMVREDVQAARTRADLVIPFFHWGVEGKGEPEDYQVRLGRAAVEAGAAAVVGSHPHVLQGMELHRGAPIVYSLGNLVFGGNWNPRDKQSALWKARFSPGGYQGSELIALQTDRFPDFPMQPFRVEGEARAAVLRTLAERSAHFPTPLPELQTASAAP